MDNNCLVIISMECIERLMRGTKFSLIMNSAHALVGAVTAGVEYGFLLSCAGEKWKIAVIANCLMVSVVITAHFVSEWARDMKNINRFKKMIADYESEESDTHAEN